MNRRHTTVVLAAMLVLVLMPATLSAEPAETGWRMGHGRGMILRGLDLTAEQRQKLDELHLNHVKESEPTRADVRVKQAELELLWWAEKPNAKQIIAKVREISGLREKLAVAQANFRLTMHNLLTPEQREKLRSLPDRPGRERGRGMGQMRHGRDKANSRGDCENCTGHDQPDEK
ncbi:MAG TPA: periplasmic heavy metal sensor [candidate division WOR-3 bacterium]|uniref:Periplasmic heavy metal sensor n=1 Tax=candidate division WOR-3 bacterium TaxID=2052148 RepID=A0A7V0T701_UNCW3|nr:periplasmic heavy metal sensor [candidate division WOR-3 bacterium]